MVFERKEVEVVDFTTIYKVSVPALGRYKVVLGEKKIKEVKKFTKVFGNNAMQTWRDGRRNKRGGCERQMCHRIIEDRIISVAQPLYVKTR